MKFLFDPRTDQYYSGGCEVGELEVDLELIELALNRMNQVDVFKRLDGELIGSHYWHAGPRYFDKTTIPQEVADDLDDLFGTESLTPLKKAWDDKLWADAYQETDCSTMHVDEAEISFRCNCGDFEITSCPITREQLLDIRKALEGRGYADWMIADDPSENVEESDGVGEIPKGE